jgi:hypothetical protein
MKFKPLRAGRSHEGRAIHTLPLWTLACYKVTFSFYLKPAKSDEYLLRRVKQRAQYSVVITEYLRLRNRDAMYEYNVKFMVVVQ